MYVCRHPSAGVRLVPGLLCVFGCCSGWSWAWLMCWSTRSMPGMYVCIRISAGVCFDVVGWIRVVGQVLWRVAGRPAYGSVCVWQMDVRDCKLCFFGSWLLTHEISAAENGSALSR